MHIVDETDPLFWLGIFTKMVNRGTDTLRIVVKKEKENADGEEN